ncbi:MAG: ParB/RepB/Spo0J family partition protein [Hominilimicola sp.]|jgi:parB domain protein nuclease|uniref:ParB/RepB/Spo0J family partition protein n=1 Tax=Hominilimicola sp. TaxID=3073571 RepID=UPI00399ADECF
MQQLNINELKPHPRNNEFFDDMTGDAWEAFKESIKTSGIIEPIVVTKDMIIVSGHQRVRAAKELGISTVMVDIRKYENDEQVLKDLIETNIRQRGVGNPNPIKLGRCIKELEKIYGVREGRPEKLPKVSAVTQEQLSDMIGISVDTLQNYKKLTELIPELEDLVETGILAPTTATALVKRMTPSEQEDFVKSMDITQKITQKQVQQYINEIKQLKENPPIPSDYNSTKRELLDYKNDYNNLKSQFNEKVLELQELRKQIENMKVTEPTEQYNKKLKDSTIFFCSKVADFIEKVGGYVWLSDHLNELPDYERKSYVNAVKTIYAWAENLLSNIND